MSAGTTAPGAPSIRRDGDVTTVTVTGPLGLFTAPLLREVLVERIQAGDLRLVVDLADAAMVDAAGVAVLIGAWWRVRARGGHLALAGASQEIRDVFHVGCLTHDLTLCDMTDDARLACREIRVPRARR